MVASPRLGFTYLEEGETVPETAVNEIASYLEAGAGHFIFAGFNVNTPPGSPAQLDTYWTGSSPTGVWAGQASKIAIRINTAWAFLTPKEGYTAYNAGDGLLAYNGTAWTAPTVGGAYTNEQAQDAVAAALAAGTHTNITVTYDDAAGSISLAGTGSTTIQFPVEEDGVEESATVQRLNFTGSGVDVAVAANEATITISGGSSGSIAVEDEGTELSATVSRLNFTGAGVTASHSSGEVTIDIPGGSGSGGSSGGTSDVTNTLLRISRISAAIPTTGSSTPTSVGYNGERSGHSIHFLSTSSYAQSLPQELLQTTTTANSIAYEYSRFEVCWRGNAAGRGGFFFRGSFTLLGLSAAPRLFMGLMGDYGLYTSSWAGTIEPSSRPNILGIGFDSTDTTLQIFHNDATGTATKVNLGANFPRSAETAYEVTFDCPPNGSAITYTVQRMDDRSKTASGTLSTDLPAATALLMHNFWVSCGPTGGSTMRAGLLGMVVFNKAGET